MKPFYTTRRFAHIYRLHAWRSATRWPEPTRTYRLRFIARLATKEGQS